MDEIIFRSRCLFVRMLYLRRPVSLFDEIISVIVCANRQVLAQHLRAPKLPSGPWLYLQMTRPIPKENSFLTRSLLNSELRLAQLPLQRCFFKLCNGRSQYDMLMFPFPFFFNLPPRFCRFSSKSLCLRIWTLKWRHTWPRRRKKPYPRKLDLVTSSDNSFCCPFRAPKL